MSKNIIPVVLCGGIGNRLWPLSDSDKPKQFLKLFGKYSLLQQTVLRTSYDSLFNKPIIVSNIKYHRLLKSQLTSISCEYDRIILEPAIKNTASSVIVAAIHMAKHYGGESIMLLMPSDHYINDHDHMLGLVKKAANYIDSHPNSILAFGIKVNQIATNYGYILKGELIGDEIFKVDKFIEKPNYKKAKSYLNNLNYYWNSGIYLSSCKNIIKLYKKLSPKLYNLCLESLKKGQYNNKLISLDSETFNLNDNVSFDKAIIEKSSNILMQPLLSGWDDLGSWESVLRLVKKSEDSSDSKKNAIVMDSTGSYAYSDDRPIVVAGVNNIMALNMNNKIIIVHKSNIHKIHSFYNRLLKDI